MIGLFDEETYFNLRDIKGEVWRDIKDYEGYYKVSNMGRVQTLSRKCYGRQDTYNIIKKPSDNGHGYKFVCLCKYGQTKRMYIHRLVAYAFINNPYYLPQVNHKNENKDDNRVDNLEWCDSFYNNHYGTARTRLEQSRRDNGNTRGIDVYNLNGDFIKSYDCALDMEKDGYNRRSAYACCDGRNYSWHGYVFRYKGDKFTHKVDLTKDKSAATIYKYDSNNKLIQVYPSIKSAERDNGLSRNTLYSKTYRRTRVAEIDGYKYSFKRI